MVGFTRRRPSRLDTIIVGLVCMLALIIAMGMQIQPFTYLWVSVWTGLAVSVLVISFSVRLEQKYEEEHKRLLDARQDLRRLSARLVAAQEQERQTLSRELHDQVGQTLTAMKIDITRAEQQLDPSQAAIAERLQRARRGAEETLEIIRRMSMLLRPSMLDDIGLSAALSWYTRQFSENTGIRVNLSDDSTADQFSEAQKTSLYRIVQEALTNVARHAEARAVRIQLRSEDERYRVEIEDDGKGFTPAAHPKGLGLIGIQERIDEMDGAFDLASIPGGGTRLSITIPVHEPAREATAPS
ncbi:MAG: sensor histidine kinase [Bryobacterales bacterium]|nr:sensor histidine kinase [Bryobacterales bacterium]